MDKEKAKKKYIKQNYNINTDYPDETEKIYHAEKGFESGVEFVLQALKEEVDNLPEDDDWNAEWRTVYEMAKIDFKNLITNLEE